METIFKLRDRKGDKGQFRARGADDRSTEIVTFLTGKSYAGGDEYSNVETGIVGSPKTVLATDVVENDIDFSCIIIFKDRSDPVNIKTRTLSIPCPIINAIDGICARQGEDKLFVPAIPDAGEVGDGGNTIVTDIETMEGATAGDYQFVSGSFEKTRR